MKIRYKVVSFNRRSCMLPKGSMYSLIYNKNTIVKAIPGSFGIMVFNNLEMAEQFMYSPNFILKVRPIGRMRKVEMLSRFYRSSATENTKIFKKFYKIYNAMKYKKHWWAETLLGLIPAPRGTECYPSVEVLE